MTSAAQPIGEERADVRTLVGGGGVLGAVTAVGVVLFSVASRATAGMTETVVQIVVVLAGATIATYFPADRVRPRSTDFIAWTALLGLLGALFFTVFDAVVLRNLGLYHWTWDEIGGSSGFWYIPVWWMGSALLAWLGAWIVAESGESPRSGKLIGTSVAIAIVLSVILVIANLGAVHPATVALAFVLGLPVHLGLARMNRSQ